MDPVNSRAKFEVRSFTRSWDNSGYLNTFGQSLDTSTLPFLHNFECAFVRMDTVNLTAKFEVRSFTRSWDNSGYLENFGQSLDTPFKVIQAPRAVILVPIESVYMTSY